MGLIRVMKPLDDIKEVGHGMAVALVTTVYGPMSSRRIVCYRLGIWLGASFLMAWVV
jgi:hypothetical protein